MSPGCLEPKGVILLAADKVPEDRLMEVVREAGAQDARRVGEHYEATCSVDHFAALVEAWETSGMSMESKEFARVSSNTVELNHGAAPQVLELLVTLDDHDDVQSVSTNFILSDETMRQWAGSA